ncbi:pentapeptide repeat-containing protein [Catenulispora pinisilvae]|uniref:pentapeptide repeat-containing protein n=1 Tax=Catenulispora pinisilvae TaxID=2705253 RepID=UPI0018915B5A|nr:pentapeptide repeat-containing protein [Catenulispora pinisilvae]
MAERMGGAPDPQTSSTIAGDDWYARQVTGETFERVAFLDVDFTEMATEGATFTECTFRGCRFNASVHTGSAFVNCTFRRTSLFDATFTRAKLTGTMFDRCTFGALKVEGGDWSFTGLPGADLRGSVFRGVRMREADLTGAKCQGAQFRDTDLSGASVYGSSFETGDLRGSDLSAFDPTEVKLRDAVISFDQAVVLAMALGLDVRAE